MRWAAYMVGKEVEVVAAKGFQDLLQCKLKYT